MSLIITIINKNPYDLVNPGQVSILISLKVSSINNNNRDIEIERVLASRLNKLTYCLSAVNDSDNSISITLSLSIMDFVYRNFFISPPNTTTTIHS